MYHIAVYANNYLKCTFINCIKVVMLLSDIKTFTAGLISLLGHIIET